MKGSKTVLVWDFFFGQGVVFCCLGFFILSLVFNMPSLYIEHTQSQIHWQNPSLGVTSVAFQEWCQPLEQYCQSWLGSCVFCLFGAGVLQPKQCPNLWMLGKGCAQLKECETGFKTPDHKTRTKWSIKELAELKEDGLEYWTAQYPSASPPIFNLLTVTYILWLWTFLTLNFSLF